LTKYLAKSPAYKRREELPPRKKKNLGIESADLGLIKKEGPEEESPKWRKNQREGAKKARAGTCWKMKDPIKGMLQRREKTLPGVFPEEDSSGGANLGRGLRDG